MSPGLVSRDLFPLNVLWLAVSLCALFLVVWISASEESATSPDFVVWFHTGRSFST